MWTSGVCFVAEDEAQCRASGHYNLKTVTFDDEGSYLYDSGIFKPGLTDCGWDAYGIHSCFGGCCTNVDYIYSWTTIQDCQRFQGYEFHVQTNGDPISHIDECCAITCFTENSQVLMPDGNYKNIKDVKIGEEVQSTGGVNTVQSIQKPPLGSRKLISINGSSFFCSEDHPMVTPEGLKAANYEMSKNSYKTLEIAGPLIEGDEIITSSGIETVKTIEFIEDEPSTQLYDLTLDGNHIYFVEDFAVHNCSCARCLPATNYPYADDSDCGIRCPRYTEVNHPWSWNNLPPNNCDPLLCFTTTTTTTSAPVGACCTETSAGTICVNGVTSLACQGYCAAGEICTWTQGKYCYEISCPPVTTTTTTPPTTTVAPTTTTVAPTTTTAVPGCCSWCHGGTPTSEEGVDQVTCLARTNAIWYIGSLCADLDLTNPCDPTTTTAAPTTTTVAPTTTTAAPTTTTAAPTTTTAAPTTTTAAPTTTTVAPTTTTVAPTTTTGACSGSCIWVEEVVDGSSEYIIQTESCTGGCACPDAPYFTLGTSVCNGIEGFDGELLTCEIPCE
jgi:hypothetical protein